LQAKTAEISGFIVAGTLKTLTENILKIGAFLSLKLFFKHFAKLMNYTRN
jgi:hypothetical protein